MDYMSGRVDWSHRDNYIRTRHHVDPVWATEAVNDPAAYWRDPDPASTSGISIPVIGYSGTADSVLTVILVRADADPLAPPDGDWWGANAWHANTRDTRIYQESS